MAAEGCDWASLDAIWISHFHLDHVGGLAPFLFGTKHAPETRSRAKPLRIFGPIGLQALLRRFDEANGYRLLEQPFPIDVIEVETLQPFEMVPGVRAVAAKTPHTTESHAIHIQDDDNVSLVFASDTGFAEPLAAFARHVDLLILECSFLKDKTIEKHLELAEAIFLIRKAAPKRALLTHFYPEWDNVVFAEAIARFDPHCEIIEATDGLRIELRRDDTNSKN